jgi:3-methylcrotonyl-CoA carboxylase alpha subunit
VRVDSGVRQGDAISPFYDSMVAKLIVHGATRQEALARMDVALAQTHIVGLKTNVQFLRHVVRSDSFVNARLDTGLIAREAAHLFHQETVPLPLAIAAWLAQVLHTQASAASALPGAWQDPWAACDAWQSHAPMRRVFDLEADGQAHSAVLTRGGDGGLQLHCAGVDSAFAYATLPEGGMEVMLGGQRHTAHVYLQGRQVHVFTPQGARQFQAIDRLAHAAVAPADLGRLTAPMPGKLLSFSVKAGDTVRQGEALAVMEAMKMEHQIVAPADGCVQELLFAPGDQVSEGAELLRMQAGAMTS